MAAVNSVPAATPFPEGDPRNAKYFENLAALEHTLNNTLAGDQQALEDAGASYKYGTGELDRQLPLTLQATRNTANSQGLLESGQLAQRAGSVEAKYAAQRGQLTSNYQSQVDRINQSEHSAQESFNLGRTRSATEAREEALKQTESEAPNEHAGSGPPTVIGQRPQPTTGAARASGVVKPPPSTIARPPGGRNQNARRRAAGRAAKGTGGTPAGVG